MDPNLAARSHEPCSIGELICAAVGSQIVIAVNSDALSVKGPRSAAGLGKELISRKTEVLAWLSTWQPETVRALEHETDGLVERLGVSGTDPLIRSNAVRCVQSHYTADTLGVLAACQMIQARARQLAGNRTKGAA